MNTQERLNNAQVSIDALVEKTEKLHALSQQLLSVYNLSDDMKQSHKVDLTNISTNIFDDIKQESTDLNDLVENFDFDQIFAETSIKPESLSL